MCNCITELNKELKEQTGDIYAGIYCAYSFDFGEVPRLEAQHRYKKKDGTLINRTVTKTIIPVYCPFCGKKYKE